MTTRSRIILLLIGLILQPTPLMAQSALEFTGAFVQGGLVIGRTLPGTTVTHAGRNIQVSDSGVFVLGFDRDAAPRDGLTLDLPDGRTLHRPLSVRQRTYQITRINGLPKRKVTPNAEDLARIRRDNARIAAVRKIDSPALDFLTGFRWPVKGRISGIFGSQRILNGKPRRPHNGVDIAAPMGTPIVAAGDGTVALTDDNMFLSGKTVMIDHGHGLTSVYIHMNNITVVEGQYVRQGQQIGAIGVTGRTTGPHLHWGINLFGIPLDPKLIVAGDRKMTRTD